MVTCKPGTNATIRRAINSWLAVAKRSFSAARSQSHAAPLGKILISWQKQRFGEGIGHPLAIFRCGFRLVQACSFEQFRREMLAKFVSHGPLPPLRPRLGSYEDRRLRFRRADGQPHPSRTAGHTGIDGHDDP